MKDAFHSGRIFVVKSKRQVGKTTMAENILPLPIDQRYGLRDMEYLVSRIRFLMEH